MPLDDAELNRWMGQAPDDQAAALQGAADIARVLARFRTTLILGGFDPSDATDMAKDYFDVVCERRAELPDEDDDS